MGDFYSGTGRKFSARLFSDFLKTWIGWISIWILWGGNSGSEFYSNKDSPQGTRPLLRERCRWLRPRSRGLTPASHRHSALHAVVLIATKEVLDVRRCIRSHPAPRRNSNLLYCLKTSKPSIEQIVEGLQFQRIQKSLFGLEVDLPVMGKGHRISKCPKVFCSVLCVR